MNLPKMQLQIKKHIRSNNSFNSQLYLSFKKLNVDIWGELYLLPTQEYLLIINQLIDTKFKEVYFISLKLISSNYFDNSYFYIITSKDFKKLNNQEGNNFF